MGFCFRNKLTLVPLFDSQNNKARGCHKQVGTKNRLLFQPLKL